MHQKLTIYTYLKNADLACLSAKEAISQLIGFEALKRLTRYTVWNLEYDTFTKNEVNLDSLFQKSYHLVNPNKEGYYLDSLPEHDNNAFTDVYFLRVFPKTEQIGNSLLEKLPAPKNVSLTSLHKSVLWKMEMQFKGNRKDLESTLIRRVILTSHQQAGLLVNPLYESYELVRHNAIKQN